MCLLCWHNLPASGWTPEPHPLLPAHDPPAPGTRRSGPQVLVTFRSCTMLNTVLLVSPCRWLSEGLFGCAAVGPPESPRAALSSCTWHYWARAGTQGDEQLLCDFKKGPTCAAKCDHGLTSSYATPWKHGPFATAEAQSLVGPLVWYRILWFKITPLV